MEEVKTPQVSSMSNGYQHLAVTLARDIVRRGLRTGDRYLTDKQAAELLQVSQVTAHRAMRQLAEQKLIVRRRRAGTFVGPKVSGKISSKLRCIHFLMPSRMKGDYPIMRVIEGLNSELPSTQVQLNFMPAVEPLSFLRELVDQATNSGVMTGMVLASTTREIRQFFNGLKLPIVITGHVESDIDLPWIDRDQRQIGQLLADFLLKRGHRAVTLVMRDLWAPGDNLMADGVSKSLGTAGVTLMVRSAPREGDLIESVIREMLDCPDRPTAIICRSEVQALCAAGIADKLGLSVPGDLEIVAANIPSDANESKDRFPNASFDPEEFGAATGRMIAQWSNGQKPEPCHYEIPVSLEIPADYPKSTRNSKGVLS